MFSCCHWAVIRSCLIQDKHSLPANNPDQALQVLPIQGDWWNRIVASQSAADTGKTDRLTLLQVKTKTHHHIQATLTARVSARQPDGCPFPVGVLSSELTTLLPFFRGRQNACHSPLLSLNQASQGSFVVTGIWGQTCSEQDQPIF